MIVCGTANVTIYNVDGSTTEENTIVCCNKYKELVDDMYDRPATLETYYELFVVVDDDIKELDYVIDEGSFEEDE